MFGVETLALTKQQEAELTELKRLRFSLGIKRMDRISNENIQLTDHLDMCRGWTVNILAKDSSESPKRRFIYVVREK